MKKVKYRIIAVLVNTVKRDIPHRDDKGRLDGGKQVEHFDGRVDAHIQAKAIRPKAGMKKE